MFSKYKQAFLNPSSEFSPIPFWFWNDELDKEEIARQIKAFKEKGVDGFVIHPRIGLPKTLVYLSDEFMDYVKFAVEQAKALDMKVVLYDEAMYPSGAAHGKVVSTNPAFASKGLQMVIKYIPSDDTKLVAGVDVNLATGERKVADGEEIEGFKRYYFVLTYSEGTIRGIHYGEDDGEVNAPKSADLLNPRAVKCFIDLTHEKYYKHLKEYFGTTIIAMFTDEPMILGRNPKAGLIPWTDDFLDVYIKMGGSMTDLPLLFEAHQEETQAIQYYQRAIKKRLGETFYAPIATWCKNHQIKLTGHPESSEDIGVLSYFDIPCQDIVWRFVEPNSEKATVGGHSTMAKCSSDSARHHNKWRNGNECFGCCGREEDPFLFTREDMKWYLDWLFVRGVNMIYPHAFFYSLREKRKDERPPDVGMNSLFWDEYKEITDYIKRMSQLLTGSMNVTDIAILCTQDRLPWQSAKQLFEHQIEFNYLEEDLLTHCKIEEGKLSIAKQKYHIIILEGNYSEESLAYLKDFKMAGGLVITAEEMDVLNAIQKTSKLDLLVQPANKTLRKTHIQKENCDFMILTNEGEETIATELTFLEGQALEIWDAETGKIEVLNHPTSKLDLVLAKRKSKIIAMRRANQ